MEKILLSAVLCLFFLDSLSQGEIPVDMTTGNPIIQVPLWTISDHDLSEPIGLVYEANGVRANEPSGFYGLGWDMQAGYTISRELRGLPDDWGYNDTRKGWLNVNNSLETCGIDITNFSPTADQSATTIADETADYKKITGFNYLTDPEPDIFHYSIAGYSGSFVFDGDMTIHMIPFRDLKIEFTISPADRKISSFKITTNTGYSYTFSQVSTTTKTVVKNPNRDDVFALSTEYELYKTAVTYNSEWKVSRIDSPSGANLTFAYMANTQDNDQDLNIGFYKTINSIEQGSTDMQVMNLYTIKQAVTRRYIASITASSGATVEFGYSSESRVLSSVAIKDNRRGVDNLVKQYNFGYRLVSYIEGSTAVYSRQFLEKVTEFSGCDALAPFTFSYTGLNTNNTLPYPGNGIDFWGFYNGSDNTSLCPKLYIYPGEPLAERYRLTPIPNYTGTQIILNGADRTPSQYLMMVGTLNTITYPGGGTSRFEFESNMYYDARTGQSLPGGGIRIASISYMDGMNAVTISKKIQYLDDAGRSSGRLLQKPVFFIPAYKWKEPNKLNSTNVADSKVYSSLTGNDVWKYLTLRTDIDLSSNEMTRGSLVGYTTVTVTRPGAGSARFEYYEPAVYGEVSNGDWQATQNRFARPSTAPDMGVASMWGPWSFPYTPNPAFDYERGLLWKKTEYDAKGNTVRFTENIYQYLYRSGTAPVKVWGLRYDKYAFSNDNNSSSIFFYGKYFLLTDVDKVLEQESITTSDAAMPTRAARETATYKYGSANHKLITQIGKTLPDGTQYTSYIRYPRDYTNVTGNAQEAVMMLSDLVKNFRHGLPVEQYTTIKKPGDYERVQSGVLTKYSPFNQASPLPVSEWRLSMQKPVRIDSFKVSSVVLQGTYILAIDPAYEPVITYTDYFPYSQPAGAVGINRIPQATAIGYNYTLPVVQAVNAAYQQFVFTDFETVTGLEWKAANARYGTGRTGSNALYPAVTLYSNLSKASVNNYILSFWIKSNASQSFTIALKNTEATTTYYTNTFAVASSGGTEYKYIEMVIPVTAVPAGMYRVELGGQGLVNPESSSGDLLPVIDDVAFYPENASLTSYTYEIPFGVKSITQGGTSSYTTYDKLGRVKYLQDKDKNIITKKTYTFATDKVPMVADFTLPYFSYAYESSTFSGVDNPCVPGVVYEWDFGEGYTVGNRIQSYVFKSPGAKTVKLRVTSGALVKTMSRTLTVSLRPITLTICAKGVKEFSRADNLILSSYSCSAITDTPSAYGVIFKTDYIDTNEELVYKWKLREVGTTTWREVGSGNIYKYIKVVSNTQTFEVQCDVTSTTTGRTGSSNSITVTVSN